MIEVFFLIWKKQKLNHIKEKAGQLNYFQIEHQKPCGSMLGATDQVKWLSS